MVLCVNDQLYFAWGVICCSSLDQGIHQQPCILQAFCSSRPSPLQPGCMHSCQAVISLAEIDYNVFPGAFHHLRCFRIKLTWVLALPVVNMDLKALTNGFKGLLECISRRYWMCTSLSQRVYCRLNLWGQISVKLPGVQLLYPQMHFQTRRHHRYTAACKQFYLPSPRHSFLHCSIKGKRLFSLFPGKWILYRLCVCKSNLRFPECKGGGFTSYLQRLEKHNDTLQLPRSPIFQPPVHTAPHHWWCF